MIMTAPVYAMPKEKHSKNPFLVIEEKAKSGSGFQKIFDLAIRRIQEDEKN